MSAGGASSLVIGSERFHLCQGQDQFICNAAIIPTKCLIVYPYNGAYNFPTLSVNTHAIHFGMGLLRRDG